jgi:hypothetical protein
VRRSVILCAVVLGGCTTVNSVMGPNGQPAYVLGCGNGEVACYRKAAELCPTGYAVVGDHNNNVVVPTANGGSVGSTVHDMVIQCKGQS